MNKRIRFAVPVVLVLALAFWLLRRSDAQPADLWASGTVEATDTDLGFQVGGRVGSVAVSEGDAVQAGDTLAWLDAAEFEAAVQAARAQLAAAEARLAELRTGARRQEVARAEAALAAAEQRVEDARRDAQRAARLHAGGALSRQALDKAETALAVAEAARDQAREALALVREGPRPEQVAAQAALVEQARANLRRAEVTLARAALVAPHDGIVTVRHRQPGEIVAPGLPVLTLLDPTDRWVRIYVREDRIGGVSLGMDATITADTYPEERYHGRVVFIGSEAEFTPRNVQTAEERIKLVYPVKVRIEGDDALRLKPGIPADVSLAASGS